MTQSANEDRSHLGFLRVTETEHGFVGGLLVTNHLGRPLEFQCTTPVRPNRTQAILYGPTLTPFVSVELIGRTLCERVSIKPDLFIIGDASLLDLRRLTHQPLACLAQSSAENEVLPDHLRVQLGRQTLHLHPEYPEDADRMNAVRQLIPADADLIEPLDRVQEALQETLRSAAVA